MIGNTTMNKPTMSIGNEKKVKKFDFFYWKNVYFGLSLHGFFSY